MTIDAHWLASCAVATGVVATAGCLRTDADHCMFTGGDVSCLDRACGAVLEGHALNSSDPVGCVDLEAEDPGTYVHVKYGLLQAVTNDESVPSSVNRPRTVEDVVRSRTGVSLGQCAFDEDAVREVVKVTSAIWRRLEHLGVRRAEAYLRSDEVRAVETLGKVIDDLLATCGSLGGTDTGTTGATLDPGSGTSSSGEMHTTGEIICTSSAMCLDMDPTRSICMDGNCVPCNDAGGDPACAAEYPETPACVFLGENAGSCVECKPDYLDACTPEKPVCSMDTCVPCTAHEQCGEAACNLCTGECLPADAVVHVGGDAPDFGTLNEAVMSFVDPDSEVTIIVHAGIYDEAVLVGGGRVFAFLAADGDLPQWIRTTGPDAPQLTVGPSSHVLLEGLQLSGNDSATDPAVEVNGSHACVNRSRIIKNPGGGIWAHTNADLVVRNSFVGSGVDVIGLEISDDASASVLYSTITASTFASTPALSCTMPMAVDVRNSIIVSQGGTSPDELSCPEAILTNTATEQEVGSFVSGWFVNFNNGDFHLTATGATAFDDIAVWQTGDPTTDIDGEDRPTSDGTPGADIP